MSREPNQISTHSIPPTRVPAAHPTSTAGRIPYYPYDYMRPQGHMYPPTPFGLNPLLYPYPYNAPGLPTTGGGEVTKGLGTSSAGADAMEEDGSVEEWEGEHSTSSKGETSMASSGKSKKRKEVPESEADKKIKNAINAKRSRQKKKAFINSLESTIEDLRRQNKLFRNRIQHLGKDPEDLLTGDRRQAITDDGYNSDIASVKSALSDASNTTDVDGVDAFFLQTLKRVKRGIVISNPNLDDNPILFCSDDFLTMTGYTRSEVLGKNMRFLFGAGTSADEVASLEREVESGRQTDGILRIYSKTGSSIWTYVSKAPFNDAGDFTVMHIATFYSLSKQAASMGLLHRNKVAGSISTSESSKGMSGSSDADSSDSSSK